MLTGSGKPGRVELRLDGRPFALLNDRALAFELDGAEYKIARQGVAAVTYTLHHATETVISAQQAALRNRYTIHHDGGEWLLKAEGLSAASFSLWRGDTQVGRLGPSGGRRYRNLVIDLPDAFSPPAKAFLVWLMLWSLRD